MSGMHPAVEGRYAPSAGAVAGRNGSVRRLSGRAGASAIVALLLGALLVLTPARASANAGAAAGAQVSVGISVRFGPPPIPVYAQPICPGPGYMWTPGYWAWDPNYGYYWVPGTWVLAPFPGALWTPGYWGWDPGVALFIWHRGYWGPRVGFYGGINYGFGYFGIGYVGGRWRGREFFYNRAVTRVDVVNIHNVYFNRTGFRNERGPRISYNGGDGGINARPTREQMFAERDRRMGPIGEQTRQRDMARRTPGSRWSDNHGQPRVAATQRPGSFMGRNVERSTRSGGNYRFEQQARQPQMYRQQQQRGGYRSFGQQSPGGNARPQQRGNYNRQQMRQQPQQGGGYRSFGQQRGGNAQPQQRGNYNRPQYNGGRQQQMRQQPQQRGNYNRPQQMRQQPQQRGNYNRPQQMRQQPQQRYRQARPQQRQQRQRPQRQPRQKNNKRGQGNNRGRGRG